VEWQPWDALAHPDPSLEVASIAFEIKTGEMQ
jgi:hypothetical protein